MFLGETIAPFGFAASKRCREEEDRDVAAAVRASLAAKRQEEKRRGEDKEDGPHAKKEEAKDPDVGISKRGPKPPMEAAGEPYWAWQEVEGLWPAACPRSRLLR